MSEPMLAFHSDPAIKDALLDQLAAHREADELIKGKYWEGGKGCAIGCSIHSSNHMEYERTFGIPVVLARLEDRMFEGLPNHLSQQWPERFTSAIRTGADLSMVWPRFALWLLSEELPRRTLKYPQAKVTAAIAETAALYREWCAGSKPDQSRWVSARNTAAAAADGAAAVAAAAADGAAYAYATYAAADGAAYAAYAASYAADAAADGAAAYAADGAAAFAASAAAAFASAYERMANKLIEIISAT